MFWFGFICKFVVVVVVIIIGFVGLVIIFFSWLFCFLLVSKLSNFQFSATSSTGKHNSSCGIFALRHPYQIPLDSASTSLNTLRDFAAVFPKVLSASGCSQVP